MTRLFEFFQRGGLLMWPLLVLSIAAVAIFIERVLALWREPTDADRWITDLRATAPGGPEALRARAADSAAVARLADIAIAHRDDGVAGIVAALDAAGDELVREMEAPLTALRAIAEVAPLLGFLGTVIGLVGAFDAIVAAGSTSPEIVAKGISTALLTTVGGLSVAIPSYLFHGVLSARLDRVASALERIAVALGPLAAGES